MTEPFRKFLVYFTKFGPHVSECECEECELRRDARWMIRGALMFNDLDLQDDPWDYSVAKNRKAGG